MRTSVRLEKIGALIEGRLGDPAEVLGPHVVEEGDKKAMAVRAFLPQGKQAWVMHPAQDEARPMRRIHPAGLYEAICPLTEGTDTSGYQFRVADERGNLTTMHDPYSFPPFISEFDLFLHGQGKHWKIYDKLGAQLRTVNGVRGVNFGVWAPNATSVSVVGDFNGWDGRRHPLRKHVPSGVWELFVPDLGPGEIYKFRVNQGHQFVDKTDPYGFAAEVPPRTASIVADLSAYHWHDQHWMDRRQTTSQLDQPISVYEVHLGSWKKGGDHPAGWRNYRDLAHELVPYCQKMGFTHLELMPVSEHPFTGSWGYQTVGYYATTSRYGSPQDFMYFVDFCHQNGIGVILDWVPAHFPRDGHGLFHFDGTALYEHSDPRLGEHPDWGTQIFNYGRCEVRNFLIANALFWLEKYHIDGLRVDAVASMLYLDYSRKEGQWIPNRHGGRENLEAIEFIKEFNEQAHFQHPGVLTIAEESTAWGGVSHPTSSGGLGFSLKWNMGWMNDSLRYFGHDPIHRSFHHGELTFSLIYAFSENFTLPLSHDEVVHGKGALVDQMPGDLWQKFANLRLLYSYMWTHPGKKLLFMGNEFGQWNEWNHDASLQWDLLQWDSHQGLQKMVADLNALYKRETALHANDFSGHGFEWIDCNTWQDSCVSYLRKGRDAKDYVLCVLNFTPVVRRDYRIGIPEKLYFHEVFNSDSQFYAGSNVGNFPGVMAEEIPFHGRPYSLKLNLPPLGMAILKPER